MRCTSEMVHSLCNLVPSQVIPSRSSAAESRLYDMRECNILGESHLALFLLVDNAFFLKHLKKLILFYFSFRLNMEQNNSQTNDGNSLEERFEQLSRQNQQQNEKFEKL